MFEFELKLAAACTPNTHAGSPTLGSEPPSDDELSNLMDLLQHYLKTVCIGLPKDATVVQASHHGLQALAGLVGQNRDGQSLQIWEVRACVWFLHVVGGQYVAWGTAAALKDLPCSWAGLVLAPCLGG